MDRIQPSVEQIIDRIEGATDYQAPDFGRLTDVESVVGAIREGGDG